MSEDNLVVACTIASDSGKPLATHALIDTGASGYAFIDQNFASRHNLPLVPLKSSRILEVIDGRPVESGKITHIVKLCLDINGHRETAPFFVTKLGHYPLVMGIPWMRQHDLAIRPKTNKVIFDSDFCIQNCSVSQTPVTAKGISVSFPDAQAIQVCAIGAVPFVGLARRKQNQLFCASMKAIDEALAEGTKSDPMAHVPEDLQEFMSLFREADAAALPPHRPQDLRIVLQDGKTPPFGPLYGMSRAELQALREYITENLLKGFIRYSESPAGAPVLFVKKSDGSLRLCVDYRKLNEITVKNRQPLPLIPEILSRLSKAKYYTKLDLRWGYHQIRIQEGDEWKTAFRTRYGHFEYNVMPFGLTNAPAAFQHWINDFLRPFLDHFATAYLDDVLIYSESLKEHKQHVREILKVFQAHGVHLKPEKCEFYVQQTKYLGLIITPEGIKMDPSKVSTVKEWKAPTKLREVQEFLGFANFYRRFIYAYSRVVAPLTRLTKKNVQFEWSHKAEEAFQRLKDTFTSAPILSHFDFEKKVIVETDASDYVSAGIMSQYGDDGILHPMAFFSKKHSPAECNYEIYDKELLAVIRSFEEWRPNLEGSRFSITVLTDHRNLEYFMSTKLLNRRQTRWAEFLSRFDFIIKFRPGKQGGKPDALTRRSGDLPKEGDECLTHQSQTVLKQGNLDLGIKLSLLAGSLANEPAEGMPTVKDLLTQAYQIDSFPEQVLVMLHTGVKHSKKISLAECTETEDGFLLYRNAIYVPESNDLQLRLVQEHHDKPSAEHPGCAKTLELLSRNYYWPNMRKYVDRYVQNCSVCSRSKASRNALQGVLRPLAVPKGPWTDVSMDFVTGFPDSNGFNAILVVVDRLTKMCHFIPCTKEVNARDVANMYLDSVWKLHGLPKTIVSDRGTQFTAEFWKTLCDRLKIAPRYSTAFHPQTDGQTERINAIMEQYLRAYVLYQQDDWTQYLSIAEFATNNHVSETTKMSSFQANYGRSPRMSFAPLQHGRTIIEDQANGMARTMAQIYDFLRDEMARAQRIYEDAVNKNRTPAPRYSIGDEVFLSTKNIETKRPSKKLDWKRIGPFVVKRMVSPYAYELDLPATMIIRSVFHVSFLSLAPSNPVPGQQQIPPPPIEIEGEQEWEVEQVMDSRRRYGQLEYLVKYVGYDEPSWQPSSDLDHAPDLVRNFHTRYPRKPRPGGS